MAQVNEMIDFIQLCESCPFGDGWGPATTSETTFNGVAYAPFSKSDKISRMADWTTDGKDRDGRGNRSQYNRNYRGRLKLQDFPSYYSTNQLFY